MRRWSALPERSDNRAGSAAILLLRRVRRRRLEPIGILASGPDVPEVPPYPELGRSDMVALNAGRGARLCEV